jgi:serine/threonine protein kinase
MSHNDIKHINILINNNYEAILIDMGAVSFGKPPIKRMMGTRFWRDPKIDLNVGIDGFKFDVFSLGLVLYTMIMGYPLDM